MHTNIRNNLKTSTGLIHLMDATIFIVVAINIHLLEKPILEGILFTAMALLLLWDKVIKPSWDYRNKKHTDNQARVNCEINNSDDEDEAPSVEPPSKHIKTSPAKTAFYALSVVSALLVFIVPLQKLLKNSAPNLPIVGFLFAASILFGLLSSQSQNNKTAVQEEDGSHSGMDSSSQSSNSDALRSKAESIKTPAIMALTLSGFILPAYLTVPPLMITVSAAFSAFLSLVMIALSKSSNEPQQRNKKPEAEQARQAAQASQEAPPLPANNSVTVNRQQATPVNSKKPPSKIA